MGTAGQGTNRGLRGLLAAALVLCLAAAALVGGAWAASSVGSFEIDGNLKDDSGAGEPIDWATPPPNLTNFTDKAGGGDDVFGEGSKELEPGGWTCLTGKAPPKDDITAGQVAFRTLGGDQFIYVNFTRAATTGDAHIDYEFNQSSVPNPSCPQAPTRTNGDIAITFDTENGGQDIIVRAFRWTGTATLGTFAELPVGSKGVTFDGAVNIPNTIPGHKAGDFGEAALNLTETIGEFACGQFASVYMKSRASTAINSALKDRTSTRPANVGNCPSSKLAKAVRNETENGPFATSASASPGDIIEYRLTYTNSGEGAANDVVITEEVPAKSTFLTCSNLCTNSGTGPGSKITWNLGTVGAGQTRVVTFRTQLDSTFPPGTTTEIKNVATVTTKEEGERKSNETTVVVVAPRLLACTGHAFDVRLDLTGVASGFVGPAIKTDPNVFPDKETLSELALTVPGGTPPDPPVVTANTLVAEISGNPTAGCQARITYEDLSVNLNNLGGGRPDIPVTLSAKAIESIATAKGKPVATTTDVTILNAVLTVQNQTFPIQQKPNPNTVLVDQTTPDPDGLGTLHVRAVLHETSDITQSGQKVGVRVNAIRVQAELRNLLGQITQTADLKVAHAEADVEEE